MKHIGSRLTVCFAALLVLLEVSPSAAQQSNPAIAAPAATPQAQPPFWNEIAQFRHSDSIRRPPAGAILFIGSSSIRKWTNVQAFFPGYPIIKRGFGCSPLPDVLRYANEIIFPYRPRQIVLYCGDNDLASSDSITARIVYNRYVKLYNLIRSRLGDVDIVFISIKPSPSRMRLMPRMEEANDLIRDFMAAHSHAVFADVYHPML